MNLANGNYARLAPILGLESGEDFEYVGHATAEDFLGRVLVALTFDHATIPTFATKAPGRATVVHGGFDALRYLPRLHDLAVEAARLGRDVVWS